MSAVHTPIHVDPADIPVQEVTSARITGIDMARGIAMAGMVIVHFVAWWETDGALSSAAELVRGRAMPLFMLLGGVGVTLMTTRTHTPTRNLLIRAVMLMALGLFLTEHVERIAIVLQSYSLFFLLAIGLRMARSTVLAALVPAIVAIGAVTYQVVGDPRVLTPFNSLFTSTEGIQSLVIDGFYPLFPVGAFFIAGMWLGRIDLSSDRVAAILFSAGTIIGIGVWVGANRIVSLFNVQTSFGGRAGDGAFHWGRLLDGEGHSAMPAWTISALGTSAGVLGLSLLISRRASTLTAPLVAVGSLSLTFYVFQSWVTNLVPETAQTSAAREWAHAIAVFVVFTAFALLWKTRFRSGPLERLLRLGSGPKLQTNR
jgi:uncharacterized membrane protein YeiB